MALQQQQHEIVSGDALRDRLHYHVHMVHLPNMLECKRGLEVPVLHSIVVRESGGRSGVSGMAGNGMA